MLTGILFGILSMIGYGLSSAISQTPVRALGSVKTIFYRNTVVSIILAVVLFFNIPEQITLKYIGLSFLIAFLGYVPFVTFFKGLSTGKVGVVVPISNSAVIFTVLLSIIFLQERLNTFQTTAIALIVIGIILNSVNFKDFKQSHIFHPHSGVPYALITCILWGVFWFVWKTPVTWLGPFLSALVQETSMIIFSGAHLNIMKERFALPRKYWWNMLIIGIFAAMGTLFFNLGINVGPVSIVAALVFTNPLISTLYGRFVYREKLNLQQRIAVLLIIGGIVLISL